VKKYTALFAALTLVLALAGCGAETQTPMPGQSEQEEFTQNSTENVNETDGMTLLDSVFDTLSEGTDVTSPLNKRAFDKAIRTRWTHIGPCGCPQARILIGAGSQKRIIPQHLLKVRVSRIGYPFREARMGSSGPSRWRTIQITPS